jgi:hypothetical protein
MKNNFKPYVVHDETLFRRQGEEECIQRSIGTQIPV